MKARAFCPGHVTGFFQVFLKKQELCSGSRGAGMCLTLGATTEVEVSRSSEPRVEILLDGELQEAEVTRTAVNHLLLGSDIDVHVDTRLDLPQSQGFGMSAAGALSTAIALVDLLGEPRQRAFEAAHIAEVRCRCGLGDVPALYRGGITVRTRPGLPPFGEVRGIDGSTEVVLCVVGKRRLTKEVLVDAALEQRINTRGGQCVDSLVKNPTLDNLMSLSEIFARETGLASREVIAAMDSASKLGIGTMTMIGSSVFAVGDTQGLEEVLSGLGEAFVCGVDQNGPRII